MIHRVELSGCYLEIILYFPLRCATIDVYPRNSTRYRNLDFTWKSGKKKEGKEKNEKKKKDTLHREIVVKEGIH